MDLKRFSEVFNTIVDNVNTVIHGKDDVVRLAMVAIVAGGHVLFEDVPGVGKSMLARALGASMDAQLGRVQCTPDMLPGDITGSSIIDTASMKFVFRPGPVFANILLVDEINRATPKTQSALLEAMAERAVSVDGTTHPLPSPFLVLATQNPVELAGTFPLPEAQLDRFLIRLSLGYPTMEEEARMLTRLQMGHPIDDLKPVVTADDVIACQEAIRGIHVDEKVTRYILQVVHASRDNEDVLLGGSPRASIALFRTAQALAAVSGRDFAAPDDVKKMAQPVLAHRLILKPESRLRKRTPFAVVKDLVDDAKVPITDKMKAAQVDVFDD